MTDERILQYNQDQKVRLEWDAKAFRELPQEVERQLRYENAKSYVLAQQKAREDAEAAVRGITGFETPRMSLQDFADYRLRIRERKGWHGYWAAPGPDFDMRMAVGAYRQVRRPTEKQEKEGYEVGYESGEVIKLLDGEGKVELIAMECPLEFYEQTLREVSEASTARFASHKEGFARTIEEEVNVHVRPEQRVQVFEEGDRRIL